MAKKQTSSLIEVDEIPDLPPEEESNGAWKMPKPTRGQPVVFYYRSSTNARNADVGFVTRVDERSIDISYRNQGLTDCMHVDDPRIKQNPDLKNDIGGLWDFTKDERLRELRFLDIESRLDEIEAAINK